MISWPWTACGLIRTKTNGTRWGSLFTISCPGWANILSLLVGESDPRFSWTAGLVLSGDWYDQQFLRKWGNRFSKSADFLWCIRFLQKWLVNPILAFHNHLSFVNVNILSRNGGWIRSSLSTISWPGMGCGLIWMNRPTLWREARMAVQLTRKNEWKRLLYLISYFQIYQLLQHLWICHR